MKLSMGDLYGSVKRWDLSEASGYARACCGVQFYSLPLSDHHVEGDGPGKAEDVPLRRN